MPLNLDLECLQLPLAFRLLFVQEGLAEPGQEHVLLPNQVGHTRPKRHQHYEQSDPSSPTPASIVLHAVP
jgi:hypothetical protein